MFVFVISWKSQYQSIVYSDLNSVEQNYECSIRAYNELKGQALAALCRTADVVGMTTTGAAKNRPMLEALGAKIGTEIPYRFDVAHIVLLLLLIEIFNFAVVVEEAAEVLESHIVCSLTKSCQQLIMIGI